MMIQFTDAYMRHKDGGVNIEILLLSQKSGLIVALEQSVVLVGGIK